MLKRTTDLTLALLLIIILSPVFLCVAMFILVTSGWKVWYLDERVGYAGNKFFCLKFRTMHLNAAERLSTLLSQNPMLAAEWQNRKKLSNDPRIIFGGHILRKLSLDELPQLINVLKGDMSLVGPRPVKAEELNKHYGDFAAVYHSVKPGVSGLWQISGRNKTTYEERVRLDVLYIHNQSWLEDMRIIIKTPFAVLFSSLGE